ncbi:Hypothetical protein GL50581_52 [Giardia duodenalis ATCC 50581]|uniref:Uncharacterized protein n=1 Tax=Giardia intestinalis (strain ATCC 50581 / GS clone H7) TaxID=598745 RepID=C6LMV4_GIAIB|nr:Hypothetical protein GL50581_52 [Giardia intestinalis ATCC 50581]
MQDIYRAPSPATRKRKAQELLAKHALVWEANMERASIIRKDAQSILNISTLHREKVRLDAINEAKRRQRANLSWESSLRTLQTTQVVPVGGRYSGLQCTVSNDPNAINLQNVINMPKYKDPVQDLPDDLRKEVEEYRSRVAQRAISRAMPPSCDLPDAEFALLSQNKHSLADSTRSQDSLSSDLPATKSSHRSTRCDTTLDIPSTKQADGQINSARTTTTGVLSTLNARGQRLPAGTAAQKADKIAQYITEKNSHIVTTYMPELNLNTDKINTACIMEPITFALQELHPRIEITNLTTVIYNSREKIGYNIATVTVRNVGDSVVSLRLIPKGAIDLAAVDPVHFNSKMSIFEARDIFNDRARSPESTRSLMSVNSNAPVHKLRQNLGAVPSSSVNRLLDLVSQDPKRYKSNISTASHMSLGTTVNLMGASEFSRTQHKKEAMEDMEAKKQALSETLTANIAPSQAGVDVKRLIQKSTTPVELRVLATQFLKENKGTETNLIVSVPSSTWNLNPGCSTSIGFILPLSESGVATPGIVLREYWIVTSPAVEVSLLSLEDMLHANRLIETAGDGSSTRINIRCYGIASDFLQTSNSIRSLSKRGIRMMSDLYLRQMCAELVSELIFLAMEVSRVTDLDNRDRVKEKGVAKYNINTKAMHIHETNTLNVSWAGHANDIKQLLSDLVIECEGLDLTVQSILAGYNDDYFPDELEEYGSAQTGIKQRRIFSLYYSTIDPEASTVNQFPHTLVSGFGYLNKAQLGSSGCTQYTENKVSATLRTAALPPIQIPSTARFAVMKVDSRFKAANEALACNIKRFTHEVLPAKQLLFYKNSSHYLKIAAYNSVALKAFVMPRVPPRQTDSSPTLSLQGSARPPLGPDQVPVDSPAPLAKNPINLSCQAAHLDKYRKSSLALIQEHIVVDAFSDKEVDLVMLSSLESIEYDVFCRGIARDKEILALTAPIVPTLLASFLYEKVGFYCQMLLEKQIIKVINRKGTSKQSLSLMPNGLLSASTRPSWAENLSTLVSMASATSSMRPLSTVFGGHISCLDTEQRSALMYLVKLRHLLELKVAGKVGSFVPCFWESVRKEFASRRRALKTCIQSDEDDVFFCPKTDPFMISVFYYRLKLTCQTVAEEEQARLELEKAKKPANSQKQVAPAENVTKDIKDARTELQSFKHLFLKHVYYVDPATKQPYDGTSLLSALSNMEQTEPAADGVSPNAPVLVEEQGIPQDKIDNVLETIVCDIAELMLREMLYLLTMFGRMYMPFIYTTHDINLVDPHAVMRGASFPPEQIDWTYYLEHQSNLFCPEDMSQEYRNMLYAHYEVALFGDQTVLSNPYANAALPKKTRTSSKRRTGDQSTASTPQRSFSNASLVDQAIPNLYLMGPLEGPHAISDYLVLDRAISLAETEPQSGISKRPPVSSEKSKAVSSTESPSSIRCLTAVPTLAVELDRLACSEGLASILKASYEKLKVPPVQETAKKGAKNKEEPVLSMTSIPLPKTFLGIFFADADPNTIVSRLFSRSFFETNACYLTGLSSVTTQNTLSDHQTLALSDALECLTITALQPFRPMRLNHALLDAVFASIQLSAFPKTVAIDNVVHYISVIAFKHAKTVFSKQYEVVNRARKQLHRYVTDICSCLFAKAIGIPLPVSQQPAVGGAGSSSSKTKGPDAATLGLIQLVESFKTSMATYLSHNFGSEVVFLDPNLLLHLGRLVMESSCPALPDLPYLTNVFSELTNYMNLSLYAYEADKCTPFTTEKLITKTETQDEGLDEEHEEKLMATDSPNQRAKQPSVSNPASKPGASKRPRNRANLTLSVFNTEDGSRPYLGLTEQTESLYLESLTPQQAKEYQLAKAFYEGLNEEVTGIERFVKKKVDYTPEFNEPLDIGSLVYELKLASFQREFDTFIDALFTHYTDDLIAEHCDRLRLYDDELDEYELTYQKLVGISSGELTAEEAGIDPDAAIHPSELPAPVRPDVTLYSTFQQAEAKNDADCFTIRKYIGFTYSSSYQKTSLEYFVEGLILTMLELVQVAKRSYRSQAPLEYDAQEYDKKFDDAVWDIIGTCGYTELDVKAIEAKYALPDRLESPSNGQDMHRTTSHTYMSDEGEDELSGAMSAFPKRPSSAYAEVLNGDGVVLSNEDAASNKEPAVSEAGTAADEEKADASTEDDECRNDKQLYQEPPQLPRSFRIPVEALEKLCALFCIKPSSLTDAESIKAQALAAMQSKDTSGPSTLDVSLTSFIENIGVRSLSSFESLYSYLSTHVDTTGSSTGASKAMRLPVYMSLLTPSGPFGTIFADAIVQPSTTKCSYVVDITEENAMLLAGNLNLSPPKPEKETKSKASPTKSNAPQKDQKQPIKPELVPKEGKNLLNAAVESLANSSKFQEGVKNAEEESASDTDESMAPEAEEEYVAPMNKPVEVETTARRDVWGVLFDRFVDRAFAWVDACNKVPELIVKVVNYSVRDFADFVDY